MNKLGITAEEQKALQAIADQGFLFRQLLRAMPDHLSEKYEEYFGHRGARSMTNGVVNRFCGITLAMIKGYSAAERKAYLEERRIARDQDSN